MRIADFAKAGGVGVETVRYYQRIGLLARPALSEQSRHYTPEHLKALKFIRRAKALGFTLAEVASLLALSLRACRDAQEIARDRLSEIAVKIAALSRMEKALTTVLLRCASGDPYGGCPIIQTLASDDIC